MNLPKTFESQRLNYRLMNMEDIDYIYRQFSDPDMCRYFNEPPCSREGARQIIEHYLDPDKKDHLRLSMFSKETGDFIGTCGYHYWERDKKQVEIGYDIWKEYWRRGFMSEAMPVLINLCFEHLDVDCIYIFAHPENTAS